MNGNQSVVVIVNEYVTDFFHDCYQVIHVVR